ncbi:hypothetical protein KY348_00230 [Candidatus Woesearchaeota archaeon]|nr:hypothetical protein [Candidatus Woesearchaeota archaeon]
MQVAEIMIYVIVAILVGSLILLAMRIDYSKQHSGYQEAFANEEKPVFKVESKDFPLEVAKRWEECGLGTMNKSSSVYVHDDALINESFVITELKRLDKCDIIDCYNTENRFILTNFPITTPKIINIRCFNNTLIIG